MSTFRSSLQPRQAQSRMSGCMCCQSRGACDRPTARRLQNPLRCLASAESSSSAASRHSAAARTSWKLPAHRRTCTVSAWTWVPAITAPGADLLARTHQIWQNIACQRIFPGNEVGRLFAAASVESCRRTLLHHASWALGIFWVILIAAAPFMPADSREYQDKTETELLASAVPSDLSVLVVSGSWTYLPRPLPS